MKRRTKKTKPKAVKKAVQTVSHFTPYTVELVHIRPKAEPVRHYVYVYAVGELYTIEMHKQDPPTRTSRIGFYGQGKAEWTLAKVKASKAVTELDLTFKGKVTRYIALTRMARMLERDIEIYLMQQEQISNLYQSQKK